jgi:hypothetical protein
LGSSVAGAFFVTTAVSVFVLVITDVLRGKMTVASLLFLGSIVYDIFFVTGGFFVVGGGIGATSLIRLKLKLISGQVN